MLFMHSHYQFRWCFIERHSEFLFRTANNSSCYTPDQHDEDEKVEDCPIIIRLLKALKFYQELNAHKDAKNYDKLTEYLDTEYVTLLYDYTHVYYMSSPK